MNERLSRLHEPADALVNALVNALGLPIVGGHAHTVRVSGCADCGAPDAPNSIGGQKRCNSCALTALSAVTTDRDGTPGLAHELPLAPRQRQRAHPTRLRTRALARRKADAEAVRKLKLMHLPDYNTLLAEQMRLDGQAPPKTRPLDIYLRQLASRRLLALVQRMDDA
jgi:hypothetical protein